MTIVIYRGHKSTIQQQQRNNLRLVKRRHHSVALEGVPEDVAITINVSMSPGVFRGCFQRLCLILLTQAHF